MANAAKAIAADSTSSHVFLSPVCTRSQIHITKTAIAAINITNERTPKKDVGVVLCVRRMGDIMIGFIETQRYKRNANSKC